MQRRTSRRLAIRPSCRRSPKRCRTPRPPARLTSSWQRMDRRTRDSCEADRAREEASASTRCRTTTGVTDAKQWRPRDVTEAYIASYRGRSRRSSWPRPTFGSSMQGSGMDSAEASPRYAVAGTASHRASFAYLQNDHGISRTRSADADCTSWTEPSCTARAHRAAAARAADTDAVHGAEFAASSPFLYFADHKPELMRAGAWRRAAFLGQFASLASERMRNCSPIQVQRKRSCAAKLDHSERERHGPIFALHRDLLALRRRRCSVEHAGRRDGRRRGARAARVPVAARAVAR